MSATTDGSPRGDPRAGFTLIELMLALAIMALIASLALPRLRPAGSPAGLRAKAYETAALLRADRTAARRTGKIVETGFDPIARTIRSGAGHAVVALPDAVAARVVGPLGRGFRFYPDGRSSGGALVLASTTSRLDLTVDAFTSAIALTAPPPREEPQ